MNKMKINFKIYSNWSLAGLIAGGVFALTSFIRYYGIYPDFDKAIAYTSIGLIVMALAWIHNELIGKENRLYAVEEYLTDKSKEDYSGKINKLQERDENMKNWAENMIKKMFMAAGKFQNG